MAQATNPYKECKHCLVTIDINKIVTSTGYTENDEAYGVVGNKLPGLKCPKRKGQDHEFELIEQVGAQSRNLEKILETMNLLLLQSNCALGGSALQSSTTERQNRDKLIPKMKQFYGLNKVQSQITGNPDITKDENEQYKKINNGRDHPSKIVVAHITALKQCQGLILSNRGFKRKFLPNDPANLMLIEKKYEESYDKGKWILIYNPINKAYTCYVLHRKIPNDNDNDNNDKEKTIINDLIVNVHGKDFIMPKQQQDKSIDGPFIRSIYKHSYDSIQISYSFGYIGVKERDDLLNVVKLSSQTEEKKQDEDEDEDEDEEEDNEKDGEEESEQDSKILAIIKRHATSTVNDESKQAIKSQQQQQPRDSPSPAPPNMYETEC